VELLEKFSRVREARQAVRRVELRVIEIFKYSRSFNGLLRLRTFQDALQSLGVRTSG